MELPENNGARAYIDPRSTLAKTRWQVHLNPKAENAEFISTSLQKELPEAIQTAHVQHAPAFSNLVPGQVIWNLTCVDSDGISTLSGPVLLEGGKTSGFSCGEDDLWSCFVNPQKPSEIRPCGSAHFCYRSAIYIIDAGLCPCRRCCVSLAEVATRTESMILVRPMVDYELIKTGRTTLPLNHTFFLLFRPNEKTFLVFHSHIEERPRDEGRYIDINAEHDVSRHPTDVWFRCNACHPIGKEGSNVTVVFRDAVDKKKRSGRVDVKCVSCGGSMTLLQKASGDFPKKRLESRDLKDKK